MPKASWSKCRIVTPWRSNVSRKSSLLKAVIDKARPRFTSKYSIGQSILVSITAYPSRRAVSGDVLDVTQARYVVVDERTVRVTGSRWEPAAYTMKLEGTGTGAFQLSQFAMDGA